MALRTQQHSPVFRQTHKKVRSHGKQLIRHIGRVAIFHLRITPLSRAAGVNVIQTAARYAATVLTDHRTGERYDFTKVTGVVYQEIIGPGAGERCRRMLPNQRTFDCHTQPVYGLCMATKTISVETDAYTLLAREKRDHTESFSRVIRRLFAERPALTAGELLDVMQEFKGKGAGPRRKRS